MVANLIDHEQGQRVLILLVLCVLGVWIGCSYERDHTVVTDGVSQEDAASGEQDYRGMLDRVRNRTAYQTSLEQVKRAVETFQVDLGRLPTNLYELVRFRYIDKLPEEAPPGFAWGYDSVHGRVSFMKLPEDEQQPSVQE